MELIVVVVIIGVLAAIAIPSYRIQMMKMGNQEAVRVLMAVWEANQDYYRENGSYATNVNQLAVDIPALKNFQPPNAAPFCGMGGQPPFIASIQINSGLYTLYASTPGNIVCTDPYSGGLCKKMGFIYWNGIFIC